MRAPIKSAAGYRPEENTGSQKLMLIGSLLSDLGTGQGPQNLLQTQQYLAQQQQQARKQSALESLNGLFAGQAPSAPGAMGFDQAAAPGPYADGMAPAPHAPKPGRVPSLRDPITQQALLRAQQAGVDPATYIEILKASDAGRKVEVANGVAYNPYETKPGDRVGVNLSNVNGFQVDTQDPKNAGRFLPDLGEGEEPLYDARGNVVGVRNLAGAVQALAQREGTKAGAVSAAQAPFEFQTYTDADGRPVLASKAALAGSQGIAGQNEPEAIQAKAAAEANVNLPQAQATAEQTLSLIQQLKNHPGRKFGTGSTGMLPALPGTAVKDFTTLLDQAKGQTFLTAFAGLKGGGAITEMEGKKAEQAIARLDRTQSEAGFLSALSDLESVVSAAQQRAQQKARQPSAQRASPRPIPRAGTVQQGYRFNGGNPADPKNWTKVQ